MSKVLAMGQRENCPVSAVGSVTGDGNVSVVAHEVCVSMYACCCHDSVKIRSSVCIHVVLIKFAMCVVGDCG